ncbi:hypothetical protein LguiB_013620 [Lonicera macranthoides]
MDVDDKVSKETSVKKSKKKKFKDVEPMAEDKPTAVTNGDDMEEEPKTEKKKKKKEKKRKLEEEAEHENSQAAAEEANGMNGLNAKEGFAKKKKKKKQSKGGEAEEDLAAALYFPIFLSSLTPLHRRCRVILCSSSKAFLSMQERKSMHGARFPKCPFQRTPVVNDFL